MAVLALFCLWCALAAWKPGLWLFVVPACLPFLNFAPWTGWIAFEEFDILLLGALAGGYAHLAWERRNGAGARCSPHFPAWAVVLGAASLASLWRGFADAGGFSFDWFAGYADALNSVRVFKSLGFALLFYPLVQRESGRSSAQASRALAGGMVAGLSCVALAALWERVVFPGLLDFSTPYRTVALFWEMHVGGAAIDAYLALATPFVAWALWTARRPALWFGAAVLALLVGYACLTTFARGVYLAVAGSLVLLALLLWLQQHGLSTGAPRDPPVGHAVLAGWRRKASVLLALALLGEVYGVLGAGTYMAERVAGTGHDLESRFAHWRHGVSLLDGPLDWLAGKGFGRLPANYAAQVQGGEFSGAVRLGHEDVSGQPRNTFITLQGPKTIDELGGLFLLTQSLDRWAPVLHQLKLDVRTEQGADIEVKVCERHLLYDGNCIARSLRLMPNEAGGASRWRTYSLDLGAQDLTGGPFRSGRSLMFSVSVLNRGGAADFDKLRLLEGNGVDVLRNGDFSQGLARWFPLAQSYFLPWHLDNLWLEVLVERGAMGLAMLAALMAYALWQLLRSRARAASLSPFLAASLSAVLLVGLVSSVMDVPRVAFLLYLMLFFSIGTTQDDRIWC